MPEGASDDFLKLIESAYEALRSYQYGNDTPQLAETVADELARSLTRAGRCPLDWDKHNR